MVMESGEAGTLLSELVYTKIVGQISTGELLPGTLLSVPALATQLNVSRTPVRDSIARLVADGLAVHTPNAGARIATLTQEDVTQVMNVRELLDGLAAREAAAQADPADIQELRKLLQQQRERLALEADEIHDAREDLLFHTAVRSLARNRVLSASLHRLDSLAHLYRSGLWADSDSRVIAVHEHTLIIEAIERGDEAAADAAARAHVSSLVVRMRRLARATSDVGAPAASRSRR
ncbi:GntR family transcriptional regulator (plasmid) [Arthrobacter sp. D3-18]